MKRWRLCSVAALMLCLAGAYGCDSRPRIRLATTTSVENSGLLAAVLPAFEREHHARIDALPIGSGRALGLLRRGDAAAALTHDPRAEAAALEAGIISGYRKIMFNSFLIVGPPADPAGVGRASGTVDALRRIADGGVLFVSRGDASGTYAREQELWALAGRRPSRAHLLETGQGMAATLRVASEHGAYTLTDGATFEQLRSRLMLASVCAGGPELVNTYAIFERAGLAGAERTLVTALADWLAEGGGRRLVAGFLINGRTVFRIWPRGAPRDQPGYRPSCSLRSAERCS